MFNWRDSLKTKRYRSSHRMKQSVYTGKPISNWTKCIPNMSESNDMQNKYKAGDTVYERIIPAKKLIVNRYIDKLYYCKASENLKLIASVYFERELMEDKVMGE